jgi:hypothetical protein
LKLKPIKKEAPWNVSATLYVAARTLPARRMERTTVEVDMNFITKQRRIYRVCVAIWPNSSRDRWLFYAARKAKQLAIEGRDRDSN